MREIVKGNVIVLIMSVTIGFIGVALHWPIEASIGVSIAGFLGYTVLRVRKEAQASGAVVPDTSEILKYCMKPLVIGGALGLVICYICIKADVPFGMTMVILLAAGVGFDVAYIKMLEHETERKALREYFELSQEREKREQLEAAKKD